MKQFLRSLLLLVLVVLSVLLTACNTILEMGVEPTPTLVPTPTAAQTPTPSLTLETYTNKEYGFTFKYLQCSMSYGG